MKKKLTILLAISMLATMMTACGGNDTNSDADTTTTSAEETTAEETTAAEETEAETEAEETTTAEVLVLPEGTTAEDGDAYLAFGDAQWWLQYGGNDMETLAYGAEVAHIDGDGTYTVSLDASNADAVQMNGLDVINGCSFCAVVIQNGEELFPDQATSITIDSIKIDGVEVEFTKNYCNYEDGNLRTNIFNSYVPTAPTDDVWTADGDLDGISAQIVPASAFDSFSKIEVTFTISGSGAEGSSDDSDADASAEETDSSSEDTEETEDTTEASETSEAE